MVGCAPDDEYAHRYHYDLDHATPVTITGDNGEGTDNDAERGANGDEESGTGSGLLALPHLLLPMPH